MKQLSLLGFFLMQFVLLTSAQTVSVYCAGTSGSFKSGNVTASGTITDGDLAVSGSPVNTRSWAVFDLSTISIPPNAQINNVYIAIKVNSNTTGSTIKASFYCINSDLSTLASSGLGTSLYSATITGTSPVSWNIPVSSNYVQYGLGSSASSFISNNLNNIITIGIAHFSGNGTTNISGYNSSSYTPMLVINYTPQCSNPSSATINGNISTICPNHTVLLTATNIPNGTYGLTKYWEKSPAGQNQWTQIPNATGTSYSTNSTTTSTDFRYAVNCIYGSISYSNVWTVTVNGFLACYCNCSSSSTNGEDITNVTIGNLNNSSVCNTLAPGAGSIAGEYSNFTGLTPPLLNTGTYIPISVTNTSCSANYSMRTTVYIDLNHSSSFLTDEQFDLSVQTPATSFIFIPNTSFSGITLMRVSSYNGSQYYPPAPSCGTVSNGEVEDYWVNIVAPSSCSGTPNAGAISAPSSICINTGIFMLAYNTSSGPGISFEWQTSPSGMNIWTTIAGATDLTCTIPYGITQTADYRMKTTCSNSGLVNYTPIITVIVTPASSCYCVPSGTSNFIKNVSLEGMYNNTSTTIGPPYYHDYTNLQPSSIIIPELGRDSVYHLMTNMIQDTNAYCVAWIDFNHDNIFDDYESFLLDLLL